MLSILMNAQTFNPAIDAAALLLPSLNWTAGARIQLLATAGQESGFTARVQIPGGAARSVYQMEENGALAAIYDNADALKMLQGVCSELAISADVATVFEAIAYNDVLATAAARIRYWISPIGIPVVGDKADALTFYCKTWAPAWYLRGQPEPNRWNNAYSAAQAATK